MLTTFVKSFPDEPPMAGYSCRNGNSILDLSGMKAATSLSWWSATLNSDDPIEDSMKHTKVK